LEKGNVIKANIHLITSLVSTVVILLSEFYGFELRLAGIITLVVGVAYEFRRRSREATVEKARFLEGTIKKRIADFRDKFSPDKKSSVLWSIAESECKFTSSPLWSQYQKCFSKQQERELQRLDEDLKNAVKASDLDPLSRCFVEIYHIASNYCSFVADFAGEFMGKITTDFGREWFEEAVEEYQEFAKRLEDDLREIQTRLGKKLGAPEIRRAIGLTI